MIKYLLAALLVLCPAVGHAAVSFISTNTTSNTSTPVTLSAAVSGVDTAIYTIIQMDSPVTVSSVTHAGNALSQIASCSVTPTDGFGKTEIWRRLSPSSGTNNVVVTLSAGTRVQVTNVVLAGVSQSAAATCATPTTGTSTSPSITVTSAAGEMVLAAVAVSIEGSETVTAGAGQTQRWNQTNPGQIIAAGGTTAGATSVVMSWTINDTDSWAMTGLRVASSGPPDTQAPTAPTNLIANATSSTQIALTWSASTDNVAVVEYILQRSTTGCAGTFSEISRPILTAYNDTNLTSNTAYCYRVFASDGTNTSAVSNTSSATTLAPRSVSLQWQNNATYTNVIVMRCTGAQCNNFTDLATKTGSSTTHTDTDSPTPVAGYRVRGTLTGAPDSDPSNIVYTSSVPVAILGVNPQTLNYSATVGGANPGNQTVNITNCQDCQTMNWTVSDNASWLSCTPTSGTNNGSTTCSVNISGLTSGTHLATITVAAAGATGSPTAVNVTLSLSPQTQPGGTTPGTSFGGRVR